MTTTTTTQFNALILDIEGTITSISFVKDELFPYAFENVGNYLEEHYDKPATQIIIEDLRRLSEQQSENDVAVVRIREPKQECIEDVTKNVRHWIKRDKKLTPMKALQGLIWEEAYKRGEVKGHVYPDVLPVLRILENRKIPIYIYSSGSVHAQKLLFANSVEGDMTNILYGYFDTNIGLKGESNSYLKICEQIGIRPEEVLFLTDVKAEASAAKRAGLQTKLVIRPGNAILTQEAKNTYETIQSLEEIL
uniref:Enolase-phosphatase E1 n=1 Tax=Caenorhabditis tropicalis TaxID=1561998 RepID=A0A1I7UBX7_9PELO